MTENRQGFEEFVRTELNQSLAGPDASTRLRLRTMRREALQQPGGFRLWLTAGGLVAATVVLMLVWMVPQERTDDGLDMVLADIEVLASDAGVDLLDDMEFYQWLEEDDVRG